MSRQNARIRIKRATKQRLIEVKDTLLDNELVFAYDVPIFGVKRNSEILWVGEIYDLEAAGIAPLDYLNANFIRIDNPLLSVLNEVSDIIITNNSESTPQLYLDNRTDITYTIPLESLTITIPNLAGRSYRAGVSFNVTNTNIEINFINNSSYNLKLIRNSEVVPELITSKNKTVNLALYSDGLNLYCYYMEV